jgi:NAD+ kinase
MPDRVATMTRPDDSGSTVTRAVHRVAVLGSPDKPGAADALARAHRWLAGRAAVVYSELSYDSHPALAARPDLLIVFGGDGTLIAAAHGLKKQQLPIIGVNLGKLGYLADFTIDELESEGDFLFSGALPVTRRAMMDVCLQHVDGHESRYPAVNDCVVQAGAPFHMIHMIAEVDGDEVADIRGDGLIVATPSGSTAHNLAAGGPVLEPTGEAFILTPICPQALTYRPLVLNSRRRIVIRVIQANKGTTVAIDGRVGHAFQASDRIVITRYAADFLLVRNPKRSEWHALRRKLRWGEGPNMH